MRFTITAGHGAGDPGAVAKSGETEAALMTELRDIVAAKLRAMGHEVKTDGARWENWPLVRALSLFPKSDVSVELHTNAVADPGARGVEVFSKIEHREMAREFARRIAHVLETPVRGSHGGWKDQKDSAKGKLAVVGAGGLLIETFFISNPAELARYLDRKWLVASAIAETLSPTRWGSS